MSDRVFALLHRLPLDVLHLARENPTWGYRRVHGELLVLGVKVAASTVWEILRDVGIDPSPERNSSTWADFLRSQAEALPACDFLETVTLSGARLFAFAVIEHGSRRIRIPGATAHPTASWVTQAANELDHGTLDADLPTRVLDRTLIWIQRHLIHALREFEQSYNEHRPHQGTVNARPLYPLPPPITDPDQITHLNIEESTTRRNPPRI